MDPPSFVFVTVDTGFSVGICICIASEENVDDCAFSYTILTTRRWGSAK